MSTSSTPHQPRLILTQCLSQGWQLVWQSLPQSLLAAILWLLLLTPLQLLPAAGQLLSTLLYLPLCALFFALYRAQWRGEKALWSALSTPLNQLPTLIWASVLLSAGIAAGLMLLVIPGLLLYVLWQFSSALIIDRQLSAWEALGTSMKLAWQDLPNLAGLLLILFALHLLGAALAGIGLLLSVPLAHAALFIAYQQLSGATAAA